MWRCLQWCGIWLGLHWNKLVGMFFCLLNGVCMGGVGTIVLCGAVALRTVRWWRAVCLEYNAVYGVTLLGFTWVVSLAWLLVFSESLKDCVRGNGLGVVKVVVRCKLGVNVKSFDRI